MKHAIVVLGMHRSGTSVIASEVNNLGFQIINDVPPNDENPNGFYEHLNLQIFNEALLKQFNTYWGNPYFSAALEQLFNEPQKYQELYIKGNEILKEYVQWENFAIKDPRMCILLPFWNRVFQNIQSTVFHPLMVIRNPLQTISSLGIRSAKHPTMSIGPSEEMALRLWITYNFKLIQTLKNEPIILIDFDSFMANPQQLSKLLVQFCEVPGEINTRESLSSSVQINKNLKHHNQNISRAAIQGISPKLEWAYDFYTDLLAWSEKIIPLTEITKIVNKYESLYISSFENSEAMGITLNYYYQLLQKEVQKNERIEIKKQKEVTYTSEEKLAVYIQYIKYRRQDAKQLFTHLRDMWIIYQSKKFDKMWYYHNYMDVFNQQSNTRWWNRRESRWLPLRMVSKIITHPITQFVNEGAYALKNPAPHFNTPDYLMKYPDVLKSKINPYAHYIKTGEKEGRISTLAHNKMHATLFGENLYHANTQNEFKKITTYQLEQQTESNLPFITIIVPNYNHCGFLEQRLESIYQQTYQNFEVILLDDCSTDESLQILLNYAHKYKNNTQFIPNQQNSGSVFVQWQKGIALAKGDLIWIAESDDWCSLNFLEEQIDFFKDEAVMLSYCRSDFVRGSAGRVESNLESYLSDIHPTIWNAPFIHTAHQLVNQGWGIKNLIPNVSSALFRNPGKIPLLENDQWQHMKICGDWLFYLHIIQGGLVAYTHLATNYYRLHSNNTSTSTYTKDIYYKEHEIMGCHINALYAVPESIFQKLQLQVEKQWKLFRTDYTEANFKKCFDLEVIKNAKQLRKPHIMMASYAFSSGGGELFPIHLSNILSQNGYAVTFLTCDQETRQIGVRKKLNSRIPVVSNYYKLQQMITDLGIDIIHSHHQWVESHIIYQCANPKIVRHVVTLHGMYETIPKHIQKKTMPYLLENIDHWVYITDKNLNPFIEMNQMNQEKFTKIGNALSETLIHPVSLSDFGIPKCDAVLCLASRGIAEKGWEEAITAVKIAREISKRDIHLIILGDGEEYIRLKPSIPNYIHMLGFQNNVCDFFAACDLGLLPSRFAGESYPLVIIECLLAGKPMIATALGEIPLMLDTPTGFAGELFELEKGKIPVEKLANKILKCIEDSNDYQSLVSNAKLAAQKFDYNKLYENYDQVYKRISKGSLTNSLPISEGNIL